MSAFIVDANVVSELWKANPNPNVVAWLESAEWFLPAPVIAEMQEGASACKKPETREALSAKIKELMRTNTVLDWDGETARSWGTLRHSSKAKRKSTKLWDSLIDAMGVRYGYVIATRNKSDFHHSQTFDPWTFGMAQGVAEPP
jgi:predicted nucleic acid-binding protein